ncbi:hypothetical protein PFISCL1PPCAC_13973 [Pristionchus fissidentatus]|uniref:Peptidase M3A/M3B catalytic domain-containing protein n=1 Tax=Pristionchus fissidentatus TaxID=1538716 RepID=A0AAV5VT93_9BILA|nr:hypothetical protein PFISCL1PPCAC_13973 [Pristionchus fissidentatus]
MQRASGVRQLLRPRGWRQAGASSASTLRPELSLLKPERRVVDGSQRRSILFKMGNETPSRVVGYYVLFPVIPDETVENNPFLYNIAKNEDWPKLSSATPQQMYEGTVRQLMEFGATTMEHLEYLEKTEGEPRTFESVVEPLLHEEYEVNYAFQTLLLKMLTDWPDCSRKLFDADLHHIKIMCARDHMEKLSSPVFQKAIAELYERKEGLTDWQLRLLEWYLLEIKASGWDKQDEKTRKMIGSWSRFIDEFRSKYIRNVMATNDQNTFSVTDPGALKDAPPHVLQQLAVEPDRWATGPWRAKMTPHSIFPLLQYCGDRQLRAGAWEKWTSKASFDHDFYNNSINIEELRHNNEGLAKTLGYASVAEHRLANKMAASPDTVRNFLNALVRRVRPVFIDRTEAWAAFAARELIGAELRPADLFYVCRKEAEQHHDMKPLELMRHFPFWATWDNLTQLVSHIFNLSFKDVTATIPERAHSEVRVYAVADLSTGDHLGRLYVDPFDRENKRGGWNAMLARTESKERGMDKLVYLVGAAAAPTAAEPSMLHHAQLQQLLGTFGRAVQLLLSRSPYRDIAIPWSPFYASDWDAADLFPSFLQMFVHKPTLLQSLSAPHVSTGARLSDEEANNASLALSRSTLWESYRTLFWADFDLSIYEMENRKDKFWLDLYRDLHKEYFPWKMARNDYQPCSFTPIFALQPHMSMHYRKLWSEMLALDVHETFDAENDERKTGERLKTTLLNRGSGDVAKELYRRFQGRDPSVGAICDFYDPPAYYNMGDDSSAAGEARRQ